MFDAPKIKLLVIDPQKDFMDIEGAALPVPGANADMDRLALMLMRITNNFRTLSTLSNMSNIIVSFDMHHVLDVGHPRFWRNTHGSHPAPFTQFFSGDMAYGNINQILPVNPEWYLDQLESAKRREATGKKPNMIWPEHCLIGSEGATVQDNLFYELKEWEAVSSVNVEYVIKGLYPLREQFGIFEAEDPDPREPSTMLNVDLLSKLDEADIIGVAGEALSHCDMASVDQMIRRINPHKIHLLTDCMSSVPKVGDGPDFPALSRAWLREKERAGVTLTTSVDFLR